jgi:hypothetical protein
VLGLLPRTPSPTSEAAISRAPWRGKRIVLTPRSAAKRGVTQSAAPVGQGAQAPSGSGVTATEVAKKGKWMAGEVRAINPDYVSV